MRVQLSRKKGWRMPPNTVKVDRTTKWGNPFIVGHNGSAAECVYWCILTISGYFNLSTGGPAMDRQEAFIEALKAEKAAGYPTLKGKNLACWCPVGKPCHGDVLLEIANKKRPAKLNALMARYGVRMVDGVAITINPASTRANKA